MSTNDSVAIISVAGSGKTETIANEIANQENAERILVLTFTTVNQDEVHDRIRQKLPPSFQAPIVMGWYAFLLSEIIKPYIPLYCEGIHVKGLHYLQGNEQVSRFAKGSSRYIDRSGNVYNTKISLLANKVLEASSGKAIKRLEAAFDAVFIDEVQDLTGNDLDILQALFDSCVSVVLMGDVRQSVYSTSRADSKYKQYRSVGMLEWFNKMEASGYCKLLFKNETHRCHSSIAKLADCVFVNEYQFPETTSLLSSECAHTGVFVIDKADSQLYADIYNPTILRHSKKSKCPSGHEVMNFGVSKGQTRDHVLIIATGPLETFLCNSDKFPGDDSACRFYVAITRAKFSVALAVKQPNKVISSMKDNESRWSDAPVRLWNQALQSKC